MATQKALAPAWSHGDLGSGRRFGCWSPCPRGDLVALQQGGGGRRGAHATKLPPPPKQFP